MDAAKVKSLNLTAAKMRRHALEAIQCANSGHIGGSFSIAEILSVLYFDRMHIDPKNPQGQIVQLLNGRPASYTAVLKDGDRAEIFWDKS